MGLLYGLVIGPPSSRLRNYIGDMGWIPLKRVTFSRPGARGWKQAGTGTLATGTVRDLLLLLMCRPLGTCRLVVTEGCLSGRPARRNGPRGPICIFGGQTPVPSRGEPRGVTAPRPSDKPGRRVHPVRGTAPPARGDLCLTHRVGYVKPGANTTQLTRD